MTKANVVVLTGVGVLLVEDAIYKGTNISAVALETETARKPLQYACHHNIVLKVAMQRIRRTKITALNLFQAKAKMKSRRPIS